MYTYITIIITFFLYSSRVFQTHSNWWFFTEAVVKACLNRSQVLFEFFFIFKKGGRLDVLNCSPNFQSVFHVFGNSS